MNRNGEYAVITLAQPGGLKYGFVRPVSARSNG